MRSGPLIAGIILLVFGAGLFFYAFQQLQDFQSLGPLGTLARVMNADVQENYKMLQQFQLLGMVFAIAGIGSLIYGAAKK